MDNNIKNNQLSFLPLGGIGDVTRNMYLYEYGNEILIVDCGLGFADETMLGVDLLLPDIAPLLDKLKNGKKIAGMLITHGHEDHMGALPFILPQLPEFPIFASPLTAALANGKLREFGGSARLKTVTFDKPTVQIGNFTANFIQVTHSVPDTAHILIQTPAGNIYHGSDFKFDLTPANGKKVDFRKIVEAGKSGVMLMLSDSLGSERQGYTPSEEALGQSIRQEMENCQGKFIVTTYSSNVSRINQVIDAALSLNRAICFIGRSLINATDVAKEIGYMKIPKGREIRIDQLRNFKDNQIALIVAGSQGQENSAMTRIANGEHRDVKMTSRDVVVFSSDPIPGNEVMVNTLIDTISKIGAKVMYSDISPNFHVSGHGSSQDLMLLMNLVGAKNVLPIGGTYRQMVAYRHLAKKQGYQQANIWLLEDGQELIINPQGVSLGKKVPVRNVYVDEISGEEIESYVLRDRQKISMEGIVVIMVEIDATEGKIVERPEIIARGFSSQDIGRLSQIVGRATQKALSQMSGKVTNFVHVRKLIQENVDKALFSEMKRRPLILPVIIEV